ncbi:MAG: ATP phosphoribosyltransferase regulatory subunit [Acidobacteriota bacterium]
MNAPVAVPPGVLALAGERLRRQRETERRCLDLLRERGFEEVMLPVLEFADGSEGGGYRFVDRSGRLLALRTDFTPLAARVLARGLAPSELPLHVAYSGEVIRPREARLRQLPELYQLGFESYGVRGGGERALRLALELTRRAGVPSGRVHVTVGRAGLAEKVLCQLLEEPADQDLVELLHVRDVDRLAEALGLSGHRLEALAAAAMCEPPEAWAEALGVAEDVRDCRPLLDAARMEGADATLDVAPRLAGGYYTGCVFAIWGPGTRAILAGGGEYAVEVAGTSVPAAGACLTLGVALQEAAERSERGEGEWA